MVLIIIYAAVLGLIFGSFSNVVIWRTPRGQTIFKPARSYCPRCLSTLGGLELVPVFSWIFLGGKCKHCKAKISLRYPLIELLTCCLFILTAVSATVGAITPDILWRLPFGLMLAFALVCVTFIDIDTQIIPNGLIVFAAVIGIGYTAMNFWRSGQPVVLLDALFGMLAGAVPLIVINACVWLLLKKEGIGGGDIKLMAVCGLFLCWQHMLLAYFFAFILGGVFAVCLVAAKKAGKGTYLPFGPFLAAGIMIAFWWGRAILGWYFALFTGSGG